jgi:glutaconate CoA-transferase, subunit B
MGSESGVEGGGWRVEKARQSPPSTLHPLPSELMAAAAAQELRDGETAFVGIGLPNLACNLARATHAPNLVLIYESGAVGAVPERLPVSIGDPALVTGSLMVCSMADVFQLFLQNGRIDVGFLGGAQIDRYGNINTTVLGPYERPRVRLPGAGGAPEIAIHAKRTLVVARLEKRAFPESVDFITSPGHRPHGRPRRELGMPGAGPVRVITDRGILDADAELDGELVLTAIYAGARVEEVRANVGWELRVREPLRMVDPPSGEVLRVLREELDPERRYLGGE